ncbi:MAG: RNA-binding S4 domain-containing protein [Clostridia bacterium]
MRLDKYLKVARLVKRRTLAKELCDAGRVKHNGRVAKAGSDITIGSLLTLAYGNKEIDIRVMQIFNQARVDVANTMYDVLAERRVEQALIQKEFLDEDN